MCITHQCAFLRCHRVFCLVLLSLSVCCFLNFISLILADFCPVLAFLIMHLCCGFVSILAEVKGPSSQNWGALEILYCPSSTEKRSVVEFALMQVRCSMLIQLFDQQLSPSFWKIAQLCLLSHCWNV